MDLGPIILTVAVLGVLVWLGYLVNGSRVRVRRLERDPLNQSSFMEDDELETTRLNGVLMSALAASAILALLVPWYFLRESDRQADALERFEEIAVERGEHWYEEFQCGDCHGPTGGGGTASYVEERSGVTVGWIAPSINDVLYRYSEDEVRYWLVYGRQGSPMPAWGAQGGGPLNSQQIDELIAYLDHIQVAQPDETTYRETVDGIVEDQLRRLGDSDAALAEAIAGQDEEIAALNAAPAQHAAVKDLPDRLAALLTGPGTCTDDSARLVDEPCGSPGLDSDRDGLTDDAEAALDELVAEMVAAAPASDALREIEALTFDPTAPYSRVEGTEPIADLASAELAVTEFTSVVRDLDLTVQSLDALLAAAEEGRSFLVEALEARRYAIDFEAIADAGFEGDVQAATRGAALYNAYCARCHTAGFSAGTPFTQEAGSGALGPSLREGRSVVQFPGPEDHLEFVVEGSENGIAYGVNGIGRGWMPGFGAILSEEDLMLIVEFERAL